MADADIASFGQSIELAAVAAYNTLAPMLSADVAPTGTLLSKHHQDHANAFGGLAGELARGIPNSGLVATLGPRLVDATDEMAALEVAFELENQLSHTHAWALTVLQSAEYARTTAAVLSIQSAHVALLGAAMRREPGDFYPTGALVAAEVGNGEELAKGFDPARFPVG